MPLRKRIFDLGVSLFLSLAFLPIGLVIAGFILLMDGRPILYRSERMKGVGASFTLYKFRTMRVAPADMGVTGGDKLNRITPLGRYLRRIRLDELPQLWNVIIGDMSLVGPRPPLRRYVEQFPNIYAQVLEVRPGLTGLATMSFHKHEARLLAQCVTGSQTEEVYTRRCIPRKAAFDRIYARNWSLCWDIRIFARTILMLFDRPKRSSQSS